MAALPSGRIIIFVNLHFILLHQILLYVGFVKVGERRGGQIKYLNCLIKTELSLHFLVLFALAWLLYTSTYVGKVLWDALVFFLTPVVNGTSPLLSFRAKMSLQKFAFAVGSKSLSSFGFLIANHQCQEGILSLFLYLFSDMKDES